jgi:2'-5' RNA ligase
MAARRLFFALWPDDGVRQSLEAARDRLYPLAGRPVDALQLHVTVAFLGNTSAERIAPLQALCGPIEPFTLELDRLEHWSKPRVLVAAATRVPLSLGRLVDGLWQRLDRLGYARDPRPFRPHVTLLRDVRSLRPGLPWPVFAWPAAAFVLVESVSTDQGLRYVPLPGAAASS